MVDIVEALFMVTFSCGGDLKVCFTIRKFYQLIYHDTICSHFYISKSCLLEKQHCSTCISRRINGYGKAKAIDPRAWETDHTFWAVVAAGTPRMLPLICPSPAISGLIMFNQPNCFTSQFVLKKCMQTSYSFFHLRQYTSLRRNKDGIFFFINHTYCFCQAKCRSNTSIGEGHDSSNNREPFCTMKIRYLGHYNLNNSK